jgi:hypothetical protein
VLHYLVYEMSERVMEIYRDLVEKKDEFPRNKEGAIQILFDMRLEISKKFLSVLDFCLMC